MRTVVAKTSFIRARIDPLLKREAEAVLHTLGIDTTSAVTMFLKQVSLHKGIPFDIRIPNRITRNAFAEKLDKRKAYKNADLLMADILAGK
jgi:DNA-damage-inducible protein J